MENKEYISISEINRLIKWTIDSNEILRDVYIKGEISNLKFHGRGHLYFSLKDESSKINAVMFNYQTSSLSFEPKDGDSVLVHGKISVYEASGSYQIYVDKMDIDGIGNLYQLFEELKKKLNSEGLFDEKYKKKINRLPERIGVITASTGAAVRDVISTINKRYPIVDIYVFPTLVQGDGAAKNIVKMIELANTFPLDTIILGRGGGSIEDLWSFNEEIVARAIYNSKVPVISAVGHEIDFTIADFVADLRAPTPTGAAEMAVPQITDIENYLHQVTIRLNHTMMNQLKINRQILTKLTSRSIFQNPIMIYQAKELMFDHLMERLKFSLIQEVNLKEKDFLKIKNSYVLQNPYQLIEQKKYLFIPLLSKLETLSPLLTLKRGYTITKKEGKVLNSSKKIKKDDLLEIEFHDGIIQTKVL
jgi:exodeoxyribonuclease VII large subunit